MKDVPLRALQEIAYKAPAPLVALECFFFFPLLRVRPLVVPSSTICTMYASIFTRTLTTQPDVKQQIPLSSKPCGHISSSPQTMEAQRWSLQ